MARVLVRLFLLLAAAFALPAFSQQLEVDLIGGRTAAAPIAIVPFAGDPDIAAIIRADLERSGQFRSLPVEQMLERPTTGAEVQFPSWRALGQDYLLIGRSVADGGQLRTEYELFDVAGQQRLLGFALTADAANARDIAHQIADAVYEKITGVRGAFWTRIAYIRAAGYGRQASYALVVADADGFNPRVIAHSAEPLMSPAWSPDGRRIAYVSFEGGSAGIYVQDIVSGQRETVARFRGTNGAPAFSPDGSRLAMSLSKGGNPDLYVLDLGSRALTQLTQQGGIDTEPVWSGDGASLYFTSDRGGRPQVYRMPATGGGATRVTFDGSENTTADVSADGRRVVVVQGSGGRYRIAVMDAAAGGAWLPVSPGGLDESPSLAPNGMLLVYAAREGAGNALYVVSADGRVRQRLPIAGNGRDPAWGPYLQPR